MNAALDSAATVLVAGLWQGIAIACVVVGLLTLVPRASASTRHAVLWCGLLAVALVPPALILAGPPASEHGVLESSASAFPRLPLPAGRASTDQLPMIWPLAQSRFTVELSRTAPAIVLAWIIGVLAAGSRVLLGMLRIRQIRRTATLIEMRYGVPICASESIGVPIAAGLYRPAVILPASLIRALAPGDVDWIVRHELAHIERGDGWTKLLQLAIGSVLFFNPAVLILGRRIAIEREIACDDVAAGNEGRECFARCLVDLAERVAFTPASALGMLGVRNTTVIRIRRLLDSRYEGHRTVSRPLVGGVLVILASLVLAIQAFSPTVAFAGSVAPVASRASAGTACNANARMVRPVPPTYPDSAKQDGIGPFSVSIDVTISATGALKRAVIRKGSGRTDIDAASLTAARLSRYAPRMVDCKAVSGTYAFTTTFSRA